MLNQTVLVGRIVSDPQINETENERKFTLIKLAVPRSYKNENGEYETDFIPCVLWNTIAVSTCEYCKKGDLVGVKGRIQNIADKIEIIAERVTFLSSKEAN
ncbi:MAG: single-stranded DNA-binding protein [Bacilli bacterium]|jgi:single-strand DNA-binding protein|nr:single-stranded DNA-binding protein [Bacilli bacterium]